VRYQWYKDGEAISSVGDMDYYVNEEGSQGTYFIRAYFADDTYHESNHLYFNGVTTRSWVSVYPTVVDRYSSIYVESDELGKSYIGGYVEVYSMSGKKVYSARITTPKLEIPMTGGSGSYILQVTAPTGDRKTEKVIIR